MKQEEAEHLHAEIFSHPFGAGQFLRHFGAPFLLMSNDKKFYAREENVFLRRRNGSVDGIWFDGRMIHEDGSCLE